MVDVFVGIMIVAGNRRRRLAGLVREPQHLRNKYPGFNYA